ncbi:glycosyl transferase family 90 [Candidatus Rhabdochlamydia porcellionis]|jgi:hypothetical protein|uniref:Glycosyl transferase family 90 n=1 Tax=Candidatus Rhabdochlamydia porcellionis TaxID=225148 RepID=A0ABX8YY82_9BACT|nr:glycosyl transferase family 90 [Candidatus Rhabdochlamydia porcellionis]QZA58137.1 Glycosyl transferase family 90 [Candidatus Rhabdochlamydia porcellionis]
MISVFFLKILQMRYLFLLFVFLLHVQLIAIDSRLFLKKLHEPTPHWMSEQIERNLQPFEEELSRQNLDRFFEEYAYGMGLVRIRVVQGQMFIEGSDRNIRDWYAEKFLIPLKEMHKISPLPDVDFIFTHFDVPYYYYKRLVGESFPGGKYALFCRAKDQFDDRIILMPDMYALNEYGSDKFQILSGRERMRNHWKSKRQVVFFRGADNGVFDRVNWRSCSRPALVALSLKYPDLIDARFTHLVEWQDKDSSIRDLMIKEGMLGERVPLREFSIYRYLIDVDGHTANTPRTALFLYSGSVLFKQTTDNILWFYSQLKPYVHYIPVAKDLSDIFTQIKWAKDHDEECKEMVDRAYNLAEKVLRLESVYLYFYRLLEAYSKKQKNYY